MSIMKKDLNMGLLLLIVAALLMFSGFTVYYQTTFKNVSKSFEIKLKELEAVSNDLAAKRSQLNETNLQLQIKKQKEDDLSKKFVDTKSERDQLGLRDSITDHCHLAPDTRNLPYVSQL